MNIVGGAYFSIEHTEKLVGSFKSRQRLMRKNLELMNQIIHKQKAQKPEYV
jgi:predicted DNA repair protein MutK